MPLTRDQVDSIVNELVSRANAAITKLEGTKTTFGAISGNNDTVDQSEGALKNTISEIQPAWQNRGYELADACTAGNEDQVDADTGAGKTYGAEINDWQAAGTAFNQSIAEIDGYGLSASLQAVVGQTVAATAQQVADDTKAAVKAVGSIIPWYVYAGAAVIGAAIIFLVIKTET